MRFPKVVGLLPMRHHSERVAGKNYRTFASHPLYHYVLRTLLACPLIAEVVIDTDSPRITEDVLKQFPKVRLIERPEHLRGGKVSMNQVLLYDVSQVEADYYLQTHSTNPLLRAETISRALRLFVQNYPQNDSLFSVTPLQVRLWDSRARPINHNPENLVRTQDLPPVLVENSCLYIFSQNTLEKLNNRIGERPLLFEMDRIEAWDIDEELDFEVAEILYHRSQMEDHG
ncbi:MAG: acylneuraminate cytidylyltransferase family protein [Deltaproteobacteria bacterium]|nr:MAG: acylneuraminate cytidylyltransferase family protein [Deltaproteobacteria bacterium]